MKIMLTGANGFLGSYLVSRLLAAGMEVLATGKGASRLTGFEEMPGYHYRPLDISEAAAVEEMVESFHPDWLIHAAAMTQVDNCELQPELARLVNVGATALLISAARKNGCRLLYVSTDFVFDGQAGPYSENDLPAPVNHYGRTKLEAEELVRHSGVKWSIVRTCLVYGKHGQGTRNNLLSWVEDKLSAGELIRVVSDQVRTPTYVDDLAAGILLLIARDASGIFHLSGPDTLTPYDMALALAKFRGLDQSLIRRVDASSFSQPGARPLITGFRIDKARRELGFEPHPFESALRLMFSGLQPD